MWSAPGVPTVNVALVANEFVTPDLHIRYSSLTAGAKMIYERVFWKAFQCLLYSSNENKKAASVNEGKKWLYIKFTTLLFLLHSNAYVSVS